MDFFIGVFVGGFVVGGIMFAKIMAIKAEAAAKKNRYLTGWRPHEADDDGHVSEAAKAVVPVKPVEIDPITNPGESP